MKWVWYKQCGWAPPPQLRVQQIMFLSEPHRRGCEPYLPGRGAGMCPLRTWMGREGVHTWLWWALGSPAEQPLLSLGMANALGRAYLNWRSSSTCCWPQKSNWILRKNYQVTRESCYWVSKGQGECWSHLCLERCLSEMHKGWHYLSQSPPI